MFEIGDIIIYGNNGTCSVKAVGKLDTLGANSSKIYYTLEPFYTKGSTIFTPVDNKKVLMRPILKKNEAMKMIDEMKDIEEMWINEEKKRETEYKDAIRKCDCRELVRIIKTIYARKQERIAEGKKITATDEKYFRIAEENLYGELAIPLEMTREEIKEYVVEQVEQSINLKLQLEKGTEDNNG